jgi:predicted thioesterase
MTTASAASTPPRAIFFDALFPAMSVATFLAFGIIITNCTQMCNAFIDSPPLLGYIELRKDVIIMEITVGMKGEAFTDVERADTAAEVGSGSLLVYATPCMVALMEGAACEAIAEALKEDQTTVGIALNIEHISATPVGLEVRAEAEVTAVEGKVITFEVNAYDEAGPIGKGTHKRVIVNTQKFLDKTYAKL